MNDYNGYTNHQTWNVCLWLGNDYGIYHSAIEFTRGILLGRDRYSTLEQAVTSALQYAMGDHTPDNVRTNNKQLDLNEIAFCLVEHATDASDLLELLKWDNFALVQEYAISYDTVADDVKGAFDDLLSDIVNACPIVEAYDDDLTDRQIANFMAKLAHELHDVYYTDLSTFLKSDTAYDLLSDLDAPSWIKENLLNGLANAIVIEPDDPNHPDHPDHPPISDAS